MLFVVISGAVMGSVVSDVHDRIDLRLRPSTQVGGVRLVDQHTFVLVLRPSPADLQLQLDQQERDDRDVYVIDLGGGAAEVRFVAQQPLVDSRFEKSNKRLALVLTQRRAGVELRERLKSPLPRSVPSEFLAPRLTDAERALQERRFLDAQNHFERLEEMYALRAWSGLRLADLALLRGNEIVACRRYFEVKESFGSRSSGVLASLRLHVLRCPSRGEKAPPWESILRRVHYLGGPVGEYLWQETLWALSLVTRSEEIELALSLPTAIRNRVPVGQRGIMRTAVNVLLARALRFAPTDWDRARVYYRDQERWAGHPEEADLRLAAARALVALDLWEEATLELRAALKLPARRKRRAAWTLREGDGQVMRLLAEAYFAAGQRELAEDLGEKHQKRFGRPLEVNARREISIDRNELPLAQRLDEAKDRVQILRAVVNALDTERTP